VINGLVHVDEAFVVVDKPAGLLSVPGRGEHLRDCLAARVQAAFPDALTVHRLDQATSGLMVFARGAHAQRLLSMAFARREVDKRYVAVVHGNLQPDSGRIDLPLVADWPRRPLQKVDHDIGKPSTTLWRVLERGAGRTRVQLVPLTGRSHQLRVHLMAIGHPILGDALYAPEAVQADGSRLLLHACALAFTHPFADKPLTFTSTVPF